MGSLQWDREGMNLLDDDSSGSEFVPAVEEEDPDEKIAVKKRKTEPEVELLEENELDDLWAEMNGGADKKSVTNSKPAVEGKKSVAKSATKPAAPAVDVNALLAQLEQAEKPKMTTETVKYAGVDVEVEVKAKKDNSNISNLIDGLKGKTKKISTIDKSQIDWEAHKQKDKTVQDELDKHMKSGTYLEKVSF